MIKVIIKEKTIYFNTIFNQEGNLFMFLIFVFVCFFDCCISFIFRVISIVLIFTIASTGKRGEAIVQEVGNDVYRSNSPNLSKGVVNIQKNIFLFFVFCFCFFFCFFNKN